MSVVNYGTSALQVDHKFLAYRIHRSRSLVPLLYGDSIFFSKVIASKVTKDCEKTQEIEYKWNITLIKADGGIVIIKSINHTDQDSALKIPARTLEYGLYGIELKVCMKVFPPVCTSIMGYVKVNPTPMVAQFEGGSGRAAGKDKMIKISATPSHDPDTSLTIDKDMKISFFCKRQAETFPDDLDNLTDVTYPVEVCCKFKIIP